MSVENPVEQIIEEYNRQKDIILTAMKKQSELIEQIKDANKEQFDWISVKEASRRADLSISYLYTRKDLEQKKIGSKIYLRWSQINKLNDKWGGK